MAAIYTKSTYTKPAYTKPTYTKSQKKTRRKATCARRPLGPTGYGIGVGVRGRGGGDIDTYSTQEVWPTRAHAQRHPPKPAALACNTMYRQRRHTDMLRSSRWGWEGAGW